MRGIGLVLVVLGVGSLVLPFFGYQFGLVDWIDNWGVLIGLGIRLVAIILGLGLIFFPEENEDELREE